MSVRQFRAALVLLFAVIVFAFAAARAQQPAAQQPAAQQPAAQTPGEKTAEQIFKNVKVLKSANQADFMDAMRYMTTALGVGCDHCHVTSNQGPWPMDSDEKKPKLTARKMIEMTLAINKDHFEGRQEIGCATCHHGQARPERLPPLLFGAEKRQAPEKAGPGITAASVIEKYLQALGGADAIGKVAARLSKGAVTRDDGQTQPIEILQKAPGKYLLTLGTGGMVTGYNGTAAWSAGRGMVRDLDGLEVDRFQRAAELFPAANIKQKYRALTLAGVEKLGDRNAYLLAGRGPNRLLERFYFDTETGLLLRRATVHRTLIGDMPEQADYADYRDVNGVKVAFTVTRLEAGTRWIERYTEVKQDIAADEAKFEKPAQ